MAMSWRPKTASAFATWGLARRVVNVFSTYPGATLTKMTLVPNSSLGIQNTSSLLRIPCHLRMLTVRDGQRPHVVEAGPRIDHTWLITVWTRHMENLRARITRSKGISRSLLQPKDVGEGLQKLR